MFHSKTHNTFIFFLCAFIALSFFIFPSAVTANAMTDVWTAPTCEAYFSETATATLTSKSAVVKYDGETATLKTTYTFSASSPSTLVCTLPVFCRQFEVANYKATLFLNGESITPTYGYSSKSSFGIETYADILALREQLSNIDTNIKVHEFIVSTDEETHFSFSLQETDHILYAFGRHSYTSATRTYDVTITPKQPGSFIVFGSKPSLTTTEQCSVSYTEKTLDEYTTEMVSFLREMTNGVDCTDIVTHRVNEFLSSNYRHSTDLFLDSCNLFTYAFIDYSLLLPTGESTIVVEQPMALGLNSLYKPYVYVGKIYSPAQNAPLEFSVDSEQYVIESTIPLKNKKYNGDATESITICFCEAKEPSPVNGSTTTPWEPWRIAVVTIGCVIGVAGITASIVLMVKRK